MTEPDVQEACDELELRGLIKAWMRDAVARILRTIGTAEWPDRFQDRQRPPPPR